MTKTAAAVAAVRATALANLRAVAVAKARPAAAAKKRAGETGVRLVAVSEPPGEVEMVAAAVGGTVATVAPTWGAAMVTVE